MMKSTYANCAVHITVWLSLKLYKIFHNGGVWIFSFASLYINDETCLVFYFHKRENSIPLIHLLKTIMAEVKSPDK